MIGIGDIMYWLVIQYINGNLVIYIVGKKEYIIQWPNSTIGIDTV